MTELFMGDAELEAFDHHFHRTTRNLVQRVDPLPLTNEQKHEMVKGALLRYNGGGDPAYPDRVLKHHRALLEKRIFEP